MSQKHHLSCESSTFLSVAVGKPNIFFFKFGLFYYYPTLKSFKNNLYVVKKKLNIKSISYQFYNV